MARALALSPLAARGVPGHGAAGSCGRAPSLEGAWWRSLLLTQDVSGSVEKVMVRLLCRGTVIGSRASGCYEHPLARSVCEGYARGRRVGRLSPSAWRGRQGSRYLAMRSTACRLAEGAVAAGAALLLELALFRFAARPGARQAPGDPRGLDGFQKARA